jgi:hypothetical protein
MLQRQVHWIVVSSQFDADFVGGLNGQADNWPNVDSSPCANSSVPMTLCWFQQSWLC